MTTNTGGSRLRLRGITKRYGSVIALNDLYLEVLPSEIMAILGPSGSGKSTALRVVAGFAQPDTGIVELDDRDITAWPARRRDIGMIFQNYALFPHMTVRGNVAFPLEMRRIASGERRRRIAETLQLVRLDDVAASYPLELSGGQQQRVALARALVFRPSLLLMDEPLSALDRSLRENLQVEIARLCHDVGATVVYVTHDLEEALTLGDRVAVCRDGRIEQVGSGAELYHYPATLFVARFVGESNAFTGTVKSGGRLLVDGLRRHIRIKESTPVGTRATVVIRPELMCLRSASATDDSGELAVLPGRLLDVIDLGPFRRWVVELDDGSLSTIRTTAGTGGPHIDAPAVRITWSIADGMVFPDQPS